jgi:hypothetical protein
MSALNPAKTMSEHLALRTESCAGLYTPQRNCAGPCRKRKSHTQFTSGSTTCIQCTRRAPQPQGAAA